MRLCNAIYRRFLTRSAPFDIAPAAVELKHLSPRKGCLAFLQGRCPPSGDCADCAWAEGTLREQR